LDLIILIMRMNMKILWTNLTREIDGRYGEND
jgi:hypothetical protein